MQQDHRPPELIRIGNGVFHEHPKSSFARHLPEDPRDLVELERRADGEWHCPECERAE